MNKEYHENINKFIDRLIQEKGIDLALFYENYKTLKVIVEDNKEDHSAGYNARKNQIRLKNKEAITSIYHELLHVASTRKDDEFIYSGLSQENINTHVGLGKGLTEGITEFLKGEYFGNPTTYPLERFYVTQLLNIVSTNSLEQAYFKADNEYLLKELLKYISLDKIKEFLFNMDTYTVSMENPATADIERIQNAITRCTDFLIITYSNKIALNNEENVNEEIIEFIKRFNKFLIEPALDSKMLFTLLPSKDLADRINKMIMEIIKNKGDKNGIYRIPKMYNLSKSKKILRKQ